jgi:hypothetical protein
MYTLHFYYVVRRGRTVAGVVVVMEIEVVT